ncbi:MAG: HupE/UreJ family protein [Steroidobacteraceae bacterium]
MGCVLWALALIALPGMAGAHTGDHSTMSFIAGCAHPFTGLDHLLAMLGVGVIAARATGAARFGLPLGFLGAMAVGGALAVVGLPLPLVETMIALSVVLTCAAVLTSLRLPSHFTAAAAATFAVFHGYAHGAEMSASSVWSYSAGCLTGASLLLGMGFIVGQLRRLSATRVKDASTTSR